MKFTDIPAFSYIAAQQPLAGFDEIQQLFLSYVTGAHVALSGPPGVGKTTLVDEFAEMIGQPMVSRVMGPKVNESMLISYPELVNENGVSTTTTKPGLLSKALLEDAIYFADEIDRLTEDNQKLHNAAFDNRRMLTMRDGSIAKGGENFFGIIAYNPTEGLKNDLETALADRFVHINFDYFSPEVEALVTLKKAGITTHIETRGRQQWKALFFKRNGQKTVQFFDVIEKDRGLILLDPNKNKKIDLSGIKSDPKGRQLFVYQAIQPVDKKQEFISATEYSLEELSIKLADFCHDIRNLALKGTRSLDKATLAGFQKKGEEVEIDKVRLHLPSSRIQQTAIRQYQYLVQKLGVPTAIAQAYATFLIINQAGYGKFGLRKIGVSTNRDLLITLAGIKRLLPLRKQRTLESVSSRKLRRKSS